MREQEGFGEEEPSGPQKLQARFLGTRRHLVARVKALCLRCLDTQGSWSVTDRMASFGEMGCICKFPNAGGRRDLPHIPVGQSPHLKWTDDQRKGQCVQGTRSEKVGAGPRAQPQHLVQSALRGGCPARAAISPAAAEADRTGRVPKWARRKRRLPASPGNPAGGQMSGGLPSTASAPQVQALAGRGNY